MGKLEDGIGGPLSSEKIDAAARFLQDSPLYINSYYEAEEPAYYQMFLKEGWQTVAKPLVLEWLTVGAGRHRDWL
ncbi:hypothetical protein ANO11243_056560 [Dothideomycetidae sp. 11243]|nr:hypothetical protein ANO11243_056560 [fungal sp. No.11243]